MENAYSLILFGTNKDRYFQEILAELNRQKLSCQESLKEELEINPIIIKSKALNLNIFQEIKEQLTDNVILLNGVFYPENNWLLHLIKFFNEQPINLLAGNVILSQGIKGREKGKGKREEEFLKYSNYDLIKYINEHFFSKLCQKQSNSLSNQIEQIFNNCLVKKTLLETILIGLQIKVNGKESWVYERLLMEIEAEIIYRENIQVRKK